VPGPHFGEKESLEMSSLAGWLVRDVKQLARWRCKAASEKNLAYRKHRFGL